MELGLTENDEFNHAMVKTSNKKCTAHFVIMGKQQLDVKCVKGFHPA